MDTYKNKSRTKQEKKPHADSEQGSGSGSAAPASANRPKNHLITDATSPYTFRFIRYGTVRSVTVDQTPEERTWPGGALWDVGVLMARLLVMATGPPPPSPSSVASSSSSPPSACRDPFIPRLVAPGVWGARSFGERRVLELGCGVGLTGLVAAALGARAVLLTDLDVVVEEVARPNLERNLRGVLSGGGGSGRNRRNVAVAPLCWGVEEDEAAAARALDELAPPLLIGRRAASGRKMTKKKKAKMKAAVGRQQEAVGSASVTFTTSSTPSRQGIPDVLLIGDVAYQHKPGAPSHFDALLSTVLKFTDEQTVVVFGTRMRMPASVDLLNMFREHFVEVVDPPIEADEVDSSFVTETLGRRHNITIHIMKRRDA